MNQIAARSRDVFRTNLRLERTRFFKQSLPTVSAKRNQNSSKRIVEAYLGLCRYQKWVFFDLCNKVLQ